MFRARWSVYCLPHELILGVSRALEPASFYGEFRPRPSRWNISTTNKAGDVALVTMVAFLAVARFDLFHLYFVMHWGYLGPCFGRCGRFFLNQMWRVQAVTKYSRVHCFVCAMLQNARKNGGGRRSKDDSSPMKGGGGRGRRDSGDRGDRSPGDR